MDSKQVIDNLDKLFNEQDQRIVFWYDAKAEFTDFVGDLKIPDVTVWRLDERGQFETKIELEHKNPTGKYLVYSPEPKPANEKNWLLDILLYSQEYRADRASVLLNELGLADKPHLTAHLERRIDFFREKTRFSRFKSMVAAEETEQSIDLKILSVLAKVDYASIEEVCLVVLTERYKDQEELLFDQPGQRWADIQKFGMAEAFWQLVGNEFGYADEKKSLQQLLLRLMICHLTQALDRNKLPIGLHRLLTKDERGRINSAVFISRWMQNEKFSGDYATFSENVEREIDAQSQLSGLSADELCRADTFICVDKLIIQEFANEVMTNPHFNRKRIEDIISERRNKFWCDKNDGALRNIYDAMDAVVELFDLKRQFQNGFGFSSAQEMFNTYSSSVYRFDGAYRKFYTALRQSGLADILKGEIKEKVESLYGNWYLTELAQEWDRLLESELFKSWELGPDIPLQQTFYKKEVAPLLVGAGGRKVFVIISDALRYEVAKELTDRVNREGSLRKASIQSMLGVVPSYTQLGMASLLPHDELRINSKGKVEIDGKNVTSANRADFLKAAFPASAAISAERLIGMTREQGRDFIKDKQLIYVYHNQIDNIGDKAATELRTFEAVEDTYKDLDKMITFILNGLQISRILITADHGFIFQMDKVEGTDRSSYTSGGDVFVDKKRYVIGQHLSEQDYAMKIPLETVLGAKSQTEVVVPRGDGRFHFKGGARFVHGGASLQELTIPLVTIQAIKGKKGKSKGRVSKVDVELLDTARRINAHQQSFTFFQTEKIQGKRQPRTLRIGFFGESGEAISDEQVVCFDSDAEQPRDRQQKLIVTVKVGDYVKSKDYYMILIDQESGAEYKRYPFKINIGIMDEFGF